MMAQLESVYHEKEENVRIMCGWTIDEVAEPDVELLEESKAEEIVEEEGVVEEEDKEEDVFFPRTVADPSVISCYLLINFLNDAMTMLRYLGMVTQEFLRWEWIPIEEEEDDEDADDTENPPSEKEKSAKKRKAGKSSPPSGDASDPDSKTKDENHKPAEEEKSADEKILTEDKKQDKETKPAEDKKKDKEEKLEEGEVLEDEKKAAKKPAETSDQEAKEGEEEEDPHAGEELIYPELEELSEKLMPTDEDGERIEPIDPDAREFVARLMAYAEMARLWKEEYDILSALSKFSNVVHILDNGVNVEVEGVEIIPATEKQLIASAWLFGCYLLNQEYARDQIEQLGHEIHPVYPYLIECFENIKKIAVRRFSNTLVESEALDNYCQGIYEIEESNDVLVADNDKMWEALFEKQNKDRDKELQQRGKKGQSIEEVEDLMWVFEDDIKQKTIDLKEDAAELKELQARFYMMHHYYFEKARRAAIQAELDRLARMENVEKRRKKWLPHYSAKRIQRYWQRYKIRKYPQLPKKGKDKGKGKGKGKKGKKK